MDKRITPKRVAAMMVGNALENAHYQFERELDGHFSEAFLTEIHDQVENIIRPMMKRIDNISNAAICQAISNELDV